MAYDEFSRDANFEAFLAICGGNIFNALEIAKKHNGTVITVPLKTVERKTVEQFLDAGFKVGEINKATKISKKRIQYIKVRHEQKKRTD